MATTWTTLTVDDLDSYLVAAQMTALRSAALKAGQSDPVPGIIQDVCAQIRLKIASCATNVLSATEFSLPPELKRHAAALIIEAAQGRIPQLRLSDDQRRAADNARTELRAIAACEMRVSEPDDPQAASDIQGGAAVRVVASRPRQATGCKLDGL